MEDMDRIMIAVLILATLFRTFPINEDKIESERRYYLGILVIETLYFGFKLVWRTLI